MGSNYERFLHILSKWPKEISKPAYDYGEHLRQLIKAKDINGNVFPGNTVENSKMLDSLLRLLNNTYSKRYPCNLSEGSSSLDPKFMEELLDSGAVGQQKGKKSK